MCKKESRVASELPSLGFPLCSFEIECSRVVPLARCTRLLPYTLPAPWLPPLPLLPLHSQQLSSAFRTSSNSYSKSNWHSNAPPDQASTTFYPLTNSPYPPSPTRPIPPRLLLPPTLRKRPQQHHQERLWNPSISHPTSSKH